MNIYRSDKKSSTNTSYSPLTDKPQINGNELVGNKTSAQLGIITKAVDDLTNYYLKTQTYTKAEVNTLLENLASTRFEVVSQLPTVDIQTNVIYLVPSQSSSQGHVKDEWINLDGTTAGWEQIGSTAIDLSDYVTISTLNATLTSYVTSTALATALQSYVTSTDLQTALSDYITSEDLESYVTSEDLETALEDYTTTEDLEDMLDEKQGVFQLADMPTPSADYVGAGIYQYIGTTTGNYTHGYWYECRNVSGSYAWVNVKVQDGDTIQVTSMPTASSEWVDRVLQFVGTTTGNYKQGYFYRCINNSGTYSWVNQPVQDGETMQFSTLPSPSSELENRVVQFVGTSDNFYTNSYFYKCVNDNGTYKWVNVPVQDSENIQVESLPTASVDTWKMVLMYVGATTSTLTHNHWYECVSDGESTPTYSWVEVNVQDSEQIQVSSLGTPTIDDLGRVVQYIGATTSTYTNGYFYECVSDGQSTPTYSWVAKNVQKGGGGHTIEDSTGTALTQRDIMQFSDSFAPTDDSTDEVTKIGLNKLTSGEMDDIVTPLPSVQSRYHEYSTEEQIVGKWIDGSYIYEITKVGLDITYPYNTWADIFDATNLNIDKLLYYNLIDNYYANNITGLGLEVAISSTTKYIQVKGYLNNVSNRKIGAITIQYTKSSS